ncbi:M14 family metallopeptidase [Nocardioides sp. C4-1]|uniref:M14 family metallopeptidase n=1 Tax=Nocardioides sp. C4-1 TaxID=3151851 RepID=UPI0032650FB2
MKRTRAGIGVTSLALAAATLAFTPTASADPTSPGVTPATATPTSPAGKGRGAATERSVDPVERAQVLRRAAETAVAGDPIVMPTSYPYQPTLKVYRDNVDDAAVTGELITHPQIAPRLMDLMSRSDRVSAQVVGQSTEGRDLYLVTITAPEDEAETAQQAAWKNEIKTDPVAAAADTALKAGYKTPIWISNNIHGNEWEGTDAAMQYIEYLATAPLLEVRSILENNRIYFSPSLNPDGRTNATRATALGLDPNRDMITNTTPETKSFIRQVQAIQPIYAADFHGYTSVLQMEPTGPPHGSNYEYDLYVPHNYALALKVERDVVAANIPGNTYYNTTTGTVSTTNTGNIKIPYRDTPDGWDDFPPIFTAQYAAFYGAASATVELPLGRNLSVNGTSRISPDRARINTTVALQTMKSTIGYLNQAGPAREMLANQIEVFRRGVAGEVKKNLTVADVASVPGPTQWKPLWDVVDNQEPITLPRAYVIPVGADQRSSSDATDLVAKLLQHDIEVSRLTAPAVVGETTYAAGSYVVDMHQPLRGLANALLDLGEDISAKVPSMYDISAWSYSYTWGATVDKVGLTTDAAIGATTPVTSVDVPTAPASSTFTTFDLAGVSDYQVLNTLLDADVKVSMLADGSAVVDQAGFDTAVAAASAAGVELEEASAADLDALDDASTKPLRDMSIAYVGTQDDRLSLTELGFGGLRQITAAGLNANPSLLDGIDVLWIGSTFNTADVPPSTSNPSGTSFATARAAVTAFTARGGDILGRTNAAFNAAVAAGLMSGTVTAGNGGGNGIVAVDTPADSVLAPYAQDSSFIYPAYSFVPGTGVKTEQTYDAEDPFLAGHWRSTNATNGPEVAAGKASVVSSENTTTDTKSLVFGTSVFFRTHPKGGMSQAARALFWAGPEGEPVVAPEAPEEPTATAVVALTPARVAYPAVARVSVLTSAGGDASVPGTVELVAGSTVLARGTSTNGAATLAVPGLRPGTTRVVARFTPSAAGYTGSTSAPVSIVVTKATPVLRTSVKTPASKPKAKKGKVVVAVNLRVPGVPTTGRVTVTAGGVTKTVTVKAGTPKTVTLWVPKGSRKLTVRFAGTALVAPAGLTRSITVR